MALGASCPIRRLAGAERLPVRGKKPRTAALRAANAKPARGAGGRGVPAHAPAKLGHAPPSAHEALNIQEPFLSESTSRAKVLAEYTLVVQSLGWVTPLPHIAA